MNEKLKKSILLCNIVCILLMLCLVVGQLVPFWAVELPDAESGKPVMQSAALLGVTGRQYVHADLIEKLDEITEGGFAYQDINTQVLLTIVLGAFAILLCAQNSRGWFRILCILASAGASVSLWFQVPAYTLGMMGHLLFALSVASILVAILMIYFFIQQKLAEKKERDSE